MIYSDFIKVNKGFQYSVNIQYDLYNKSKVEGYIPTIKSVDLLKEYLLNTTQKDGNKATLLVGPYGKGKSHLLLILLSILSGLHTNEIINLSERIKNIDSVCADLIKEQSSKKYLPVVLNSNSTDLNQSLLIGLKQALIQIDEKHILPKTYYDAAIDIIEGWKQYDDTFKKVDELTNKLYQKNVEGFIKCLRNCDEEAFNAFKLIFKEITSGVEFNPLINSDIVKLYEEVNYILHDQYGYQGIVIVFDEFSKFIEASASYNNIKDLKILQDIAELANRSNNPQLHLICVTHKTINEYITQLPKNKIDAWRTIEGRFKEILFTSSSSQNYELIKNAIIKDEEKFNLYWREHKLNFSNYYDEAYQLFSLNYSEEEYLNNIIKGCFPLSPYTVFALPKISEKVAQNERTLFTFLCKDDEYSFANLLKKNNESLIITVDLLYDYFEQLFKKEIYNESINQVWLKADGSLKAVDDILEKKIIKTIAIINIINDYKLYAPTISTIAHSIGITNSTCEECITSLVAKGILIRKRSNGMVNFIPITEIDVEKDVEYLISKQKSSFSLSEQLMKIISLKYILPREYNDNYKMIRYFNEVIVEPNEIITIPSNVAVKELLARYKGDGVYLYILAKDDIEKEKVINWIKDVNDSRICLVFPNAYYNFMYAAQRYSAIKTLLEDKSYLKEDIAVESQLQIMLEDVIETIKINFNSLFGNKDYKIISYISKKTLIQTDKIKLSDLSTIICEEHYYNTPIINNEMINKEKISSPILKGRNNVVSMLLNNTYKNFDYEGNSVDKTIFRTTLLRKGLINNNISNDMIYFINIIKDFVHSADVDEICFMDLYEKLQSVEYTLRVRKGVIPIYLAYILKDYKNEIIITTGGRRKVEVELTTDVINNINENPNEYFIKIEKGTRERDNYINHLIDLFEDNNDLHKYDNKYTKVVNAMQKWFNSLSKFAKTHKINVRTQKELDKEIIKFRKELLKFDINSRQFLFVDIPKIFNEDNYDMCFSRINYIKDYEENTDSKLFNLIKEEIIETMNKGYDGSLSSAIKTWILGISEEKMNHLYDVTTNEVLNIFKEGISNEKILVDKLVYAITGLAYEDWNDNTLAEFKQQLQKVKDTVENYEIACDNSNNDRFKISLLGNGDNQERTFDIVEISPLGNMLLNNIEDSFEEFGDSISDNEKRNILVKMLEKFI